MSFFKDFLKKPEVQSLIESSVESGFSALIDLLKEITDRTATPADNVALKALLKAAVKELDEAGVPDETPANGDA